MIGGGMGMGGSRTSNGMAWLLVQAIHSMIQDAGGPVYRRLDQSLFIGFAVRSMLVKEKEGRARAETVIETLELIQGNYTASVDLEENNFAERPQYMNLINVQLRELFDLAYEYDLIIPSLLNSDKANAWEDIAGGK